PGRAGHRRERGGGAPPGGRDAARRARGPRRRRFDGGMAGRRPPRPGPGHGRRAAALRRARPSRGPGRAMADGARGRAGPRPGGAAGPAGGRPDAPPSRNRRRGLAPRPVLRVVSSLPREPQRGGEAQMTKRIVVLALTGLALAAPRAALAIPAFARRYQVECHFCHEGYPKLNSMGQRFRERGFRMEKEEAFSLDTWARTVPATLRASGTHYFLEGGDDSNTGFLKAISAGSLGRRLSYWVDDGLLITDGEDTFTHTKPDNAWARVEIVP